MSRTALEFILLSVILVFLQVVVLNHVCLFGVAVPFAFIYVILRLPANLSVNWVLTISFFLGLTVDIFSDTQGMNSLACTILGMLRQPILRLYFPRDEDLVGTCPSIRSLDMGIYIRYALTMTLIYCTVIFFIEAFTFANILQTALRILFSTLLTTVILVGIDCLTIKRREKRL